MAGRSQDIEWQIFAAESEEFTIYTPCELSHKSKDLITDFGNMQIHTYFCQSEKMDPNELYMVTYTDYPAGSFPSDSTELIQFFYDQSLEQIAGQLGGELYYSSEKDVNGIKGIISRITYNNEQAACKVFVSLLEDRFYAIQVFSKIDVSLNKEMDQFIESFRLVSR